MKRISEILNPPQEPPRRPPPAPAPRRQRPPLETVIAELDRDGDGLFRRAYELNGSPQIIARNERLRQISEQIRRERIADMARAIGIPPRERAIILRGVSSTEILDALRDPRKRRLRFWSHPGGLDDRARPLIVLSGGHGAGKTVAACWALVFATLDQDGEPMVGDRLFVPSWKIAALNEKYAPDRQELERIAAIKWVVLDDLGRNDRGSDGLLSPSVQCFLDLRHGRLNARTIVTTNLPERDRDPYIGTALADRFRQSLLRIPTTATSLR
jgi:hypothetical protein